MSQTQDPMDPFVLQMYSRRDRQKLERLQAEASELGPAIEEAYRRQDHRQIRKLETEHDRRVRKLEDFVVELQETEHEEPISQEIPLDVHFAELYAEHLQGFPGRHGITLHGILRHVANEYPGFDPATTDDALIEAAQDAYHRHHGLRTRRRRMVGAPAVEGTRRFLASLKRRS